MKRVVIKLGSSVVADPEGTPRLDVLANLCDHLAALHRAGDEVIVVTSGAIARGMRVMNLPQRPSSTGALQAASAVGQGKPRARDCGRQDAVGEAGHGRDTQPVRHADADHIRLMACPAQDIEGGSGAPCQLQRLGRRRQPALDGRDLSDLARRCGSARGDSRILRARCEGPEQRRRRRADCA